MDINRRSFLGRIIAVFVAALLAGKKAFAENFQIIDYGETSAEDLQRQEWNAFEAAWVAAWRLENENRFGVGPFQAVLGRIPTDEERKAVARVIQWFGTNCGRDFIGSALEMQGYKYPVASGPAYEALRKANTDAAWIPASRPRKRVLARFRFQRVWL